MNFRKNIQKSSNRLIIILILGGFLLLEVFSLSHYNLHITQLIQKGFDHDLIHKGWLLKDYFANNSNVTTQPVPDTLKIDMPPNRFSEMTAEWNKQYRNKHNIDGSPWTEKKDKYSCRVKYLKAENPKWMKSKISMTGMWSDHHSGFDYFSMKLKLNGDNRLFGEKSINLLVPGTRNHIADPLANELYHELFQGIQIRYTPVIVQFRKQKPMYLLREDDLGKYLIERNQRRESVIFEKGFAGPLKHLPGLMEKNIDMEFNVELDDSLKTETIGKYISRLFNKDHEELFHKIDKNKFLGVFAIGVVMKSWHHLVDINLHWYYNPVNHTFEPLIREMAPEDRLSVDFDLNSNTLENRIKHYKKHLKFFNDTISDNLPNFLNAYISWLEKTDPKLFELIDQYVIQVSKSMQIKLHEARIQIPYESMRPDQINERRLITDLLYLRSEFFANSKVNQNADPISIGEVNSNLSSFQKTSNTIIWSGNKIINGVVHIPQNTTLKIQPGTQIRFTGKNSILYVWGNVESLGTPRAPIKFSASDGTRASLFFQTPQICELTHTQFEGFSSLSNGIHGTPAALTIHRSKQVRINNCEFSKNRLGDDILNIFDCKDFIIENSYFHHVLSDAFDSDFSNGIVRNNRFDEIGNDGVDGSGSVMDIHHNEFSNIHDKAISCGERSAFNAHKNTIRHSAIAFVSKDQSDLSVFQNTLENNDLQIAVFQKKPEYGQAHFTADFNINSVNYLIQKKSKIRHRGKKIKMVKDVESMLYGKQFGRATKKG
jgi:hypothetical protein